ncbi:hypothetical protein TR631_05815 [Streptomyces rochei]|uniref:hypothetical protein n=1 Tax=Streptomyces rochei TaxID=1928 RepID=UPI002ACDEAB7|nr:hypothetical protein [Streptomyces rochei]WQC11343.1 hypothetical protein TR631_05815 [Streptomyces rochei]
MVDRLVGLSVAADLRCSCQWLAPFPRLTELTFETPLPDIDVSSLRHVFSLRTLRLPATARGVGAEMLPPAVEIIRTG